MLKSPKLEIFCNEYANGTNGTQSAIKAGYAEKRARHTASDLLKKPEIKARIKEIRELANKKFELTKDYVIDNLLWASKVAKGEELSHVRNKDGTSSEMYITDLSSFIKIQSIFAKHVGLTEIKKEKPETLSKQIYIMTGSRSPLLTETLEILDDSKDNK